MASSFKKDQVKLDLLTAIGTLLMVDKGIRGGMCHPVFRYAKANNKYMKVCEKNKESSFFNLMRIS